MVVFLKSCVSKPDVTVHYQIRPLPSGVAFIPRKKKMLFKNIATLLAKGVSLSFHVSQADAGKLEVGVIPTTATGTSGLELVSKSFVATPEELDAEFAGIIAGFASANATLQDQLLDVKVRAEVAAEEAKAAAAAKSKKSVSPKPGTSASRLNVEAASDDNEDTGGDDDEPTQTSSDAGSVQTSMAFTL